ncbi:hypothetical protein [Crocosphaera sp.]|uniref:hypothetical protein n=1 Tax=Crocosphaera sp. TaxID=2729996 RepID=UPI00262158FC|nr:hypothetical protein [Crocosphaera sp.]MDJ0582917.1 hypothetical protein [Crocosphaera sp.]
MFNYPVVFGQNPSGSELYTVWYIDPEGSIQYRYYAEPVRLEVDNNTITPIRLTTGESLPSFSGSGGGGGFGNGGSSIVSGGSGGTRVWLDTGGNWEGIFTNIPPIEYSIFCTQLTIFGGQSIGVPYYLKLVGEALMVDSSNGQIVRPIFWGTVIEAPGPFRAIAAYPDDKQIVTFVKHGLQIDVDLLPTETKYISNTFFSTPPSGTESLIFDSYPLIVTGDDYFLKDIKILHQTIWRKDENEETKVEIITPPLCTMTVRDGLGTVIAIRQFLGSPEILVNNDESPPY